MDHSNKKTDGLKNIEQVSKLIFSQNLENEGVMLRDVTSYFLLAYFFPGCDREDAEPAEVNHNEYKIVVVHMNNFVRYIIVLIISLKYNFSWLNHFNIPMRLVIESLNVFQPMVRPNFTNCFQTKTAEDLENKIVYVLSEQVKIKLISNFGRQYCFKDKLYKSIL